MHAKIFTEKGVYEFEFLNSYIIIMNFHRNQYNVDNLIC